MDVTQKARRARRPSYFLLAARTGVPDPFCLICPALQKRARSCQSPDAADAYAAARFAAG